MVNVPRVSSTLSAEIWGVWNSIMGASFSWWGAVARLLALAAPSGLLRVKLDDQLLLDRCSDLLPLWESEHLGGQPVVISLEPGRDHRRQLGGVPDHLLRARSRLQRDHVVGTDLVRGDVHPFAVDGPVAVADELAGLAARGREAQADENVVET